MAQMTDLSALMRLKARALRCLLVAALTGVTLNAQRPPEFPVVVVFDNNVRFEDFASFYVPDDRAASQPQAWGYLNRVVAGAVRYLETRRGFRAYHVYSHAIRGFAARLTAEQIRQLQTDRLVRHIEPDGIMTASGQFQPAAAQVVPWGIDRIGGPLSSTRAGNGSGVVSNVNIYVIDTGVGDHPDLNKVAHLNFSVGRNDDCNGHGTHVAGTIAARDNATDVVGVAPGAPVTGVKVLNCRGQGATSDVIKGVDWVTANRKLPAVANMSLGGGASDALDDAVRNSASAGVFYAVAAGNGSTDACLMSPARAGAGASNGILTVAATDTNGDDPYWSNYGSCVDIWAPGVNILSTLLGGGTTTMSGTSMASPHGAGTAALYLSSRPWDSPSTVEAALKATAIATGKSSNGGNAIMLVQASPY